MQNNISFIKDKVQNINYLKQTDFCRQIEGLSSLIRSSPPSSTITTSHHKNIQSKSVQPLLLTQKSVLTNQLLPLSNTQLLHPLYHLPLSLTNTLSLLLQLLNLPLHPPPPLNRLQFPLVIPPPIILIIIDLLLVIILQLVNHLPLLLMLLLHLTQVLPQLPLHVLILLLNILDIVHLVLSQHLTHQILQLLVFFLQTRHLLLLTLLQLLIHRLLHTPHKLTNRISPTRQRKHHLFINTRQLLLLPSIQLHRLLKHLLNI